ncbi:hypothetical protein [Streptosporangium sp. NPDC023615]|uniref:hypothetical protein n=1 Tax=Streptosporangium sp. NPDC023615 TaxID=3154794 RepID=UPI00343839A7
MAGNGDGTFQEPLGTAADGRPGIPGAADFNRDGADDLVVPDGAGATGTVWMHPTV